MNNFCFGSDDADKQFGYYETICGGSGAGPFGHGTSGVHTNMTNTRITDPEILERRYPVILRQFSLRPNSGGNGLYRGGDGVIRDVEFSIPLSVSILSERRSMAPYGLHGGEPGLRGQNTWVHKDGSRVSVGGKCTVKAEAGDRFVINSPGGGGWGAVGDRGLQDPVQQTEKPTMVGNGSIGNSMRGAESN
jgi:5-oxoprolinase (ATP-hydrolysing)